MKSLFPKCLVFFFTLVLFDCHVVWAKSAFKIPSSINRDKEVATMMLKMPRPSLNGKRGSFHATLKGSGTFLWQGFNTSTSASRCSNSGGSVVLKLDSKTHQSLITKALLASNENFEAKPPHLPRTSPSNVMPSLFAELGDESHLITLNDLNGEQSKAFLSSLDETIVAAIDNPKARKSFLAMTVKRDFKSRKILVVIKNIGKKTAQIVLPKKAHENFYLLMGNGESVALDYAKKVSNKAQKLKPNNTMQVDLTIPASVSPASGLVIYDNTPSVKTRRGVILKSFPKVRLCALDRNGKRLASKE